MRSSAPSHHWRHLKTLRRSRDTFHSSPFTLHSSNHSSNHPSLFIHTLRVPKTNAARLLDSLGIAYEIREYAVDPDDLSAESVARKIGLPPEQVFKTLVARGDRNGVCFAVLAGNAELDLKALAQARGDRKVETVALKEVQPLTGYIRGGVTALAAKKAYPVVADEMIELYEAISVSAGMRGAQLILAPADYLRAVSARVGPIARDKS
jgi:Cys-tRNA(Pro)/Cys-tRNA(Cys) deacylase